MTSWTRRPRRRPAPADPRGGVGDDAVDRAVDSARASLHGGVLTSMADHGRGHSAGQAGTATPWRPPPRGGGSARGRGSTRPAAAAGPARVPPRERAEGLLGARDVASYGGMDDLVGPHRGHPATLPQVAGWGDPHWVKDTASKARVQTQQAGPRGSAPSCAAARRRRPGLLRVELGGRQRAVLDRGDEPVAPVLVHVTSGARVRSLVTAPVAGAVRVHEVEPLALDAVEQRDPRAPRRCSSPCGVRRAPGAVHVPGHSSQPSVSTPCSTPLEQHLHPDADAEHRAPAGEAPADDPLALDGAEAGDARGERPDAGHDETVGLRRAVKSAVRVTSAPARSRARTAERRLPEP